jgi:hypothetical protein
MWFRSAKAVLQAHIEVVGRLIISRRERLPVIDAKITAMLIAQRFHAPLTTGRLAPDAMTMSTSMTGLAAIPVMEVLPTCSIATAASRREGQICSLSRWNI